MRSVVQPWPSHEKQLGSNNDKGTFVAIDVK